ncbi:MAG: hypothetical protein ACI318_04295 [Bacilli bacterium]
MKRIYTFFNFSTNLESGSKELLYLYKSHLIKSYDKYVNLSYFLSFLNENEKKMYQKRIYVTVGHTYKCTTYVRNKDYFPRPNTLLHRQIKSIVEQELRDVTKNINRDEFLTKLLERKKKESYNIDIESKISKLEARKDKLYQLTKKAYDDAF